MICPFRYMFNKWGSSDSMCLEESCMAWSQELKKCSLVLPFVEFAKEIKDEKQEQA